MYFFYHFFIYFTHSVQNEKIVRKLSAVRPIISFLKVDAAHAV